MGDPVIEADISSRWRVAALMLDEGQRGALGRTLPDGRFTTRWGRAATLSAVAAGRNARAMCILTHGVNDYERERSAGLVLSSSDGGPGVVFAEDVEALAMPPLVVLAACQAGDGPMRYGDDDAGHLGGAFLTAGSSAVVVASGNLPLGVTLDLLDRTFVEWGDGSSFAEALRRARVGLHRQSGRAHPYFFAGLRLTGADITSPGR